MLGKAICRRICEEHECVVYVPKFYHNIEGSKIPGSKVIIFSIVLLLQKES